MARTICLRLLSAQPRTRAELAAALAKRNVPDDVAAAVLDRFDEVGLIDDKAFAHAWVESRHRGRGLGRRALTGELLRRGVAPDLVAEAVDQIDPEEEVEAARRLAARRAASTRGAPPATRARRLVGVLVRRGYPPGLAYQVVKEILADDGVDGAELADPPDETL